MINKKVEKLLSEQVVHEFYSANLYLAMSSYLLDKDLSGFGNFFKIQAKEEIFHAMKQFDFLHQVGGKLDMGAVPAPEKTDFESLEQIFELTLEHEQKVTSLIHNIAKVSMEEGDFATNNFLQWFISEQVEEEDNMNTLLQKVRMIGDSKSGLFMLDEEMGKRTFTEEA